MESREIVLMNLLAEKKWRGRRREQTCGHSGGGRDWGDGKGSADTRALPWVKQAAGEELLHNTGTSLRLFYNNIFKQKCVGIFYVIYVNIPRLGLCLK